jgi:sugar phosphate isomerase/epimerase
MKYTRREMLTTVAGTAPALVISPFLPTAAASEKKTHLGVVRESFAHHISADRTHGGGGFADPVYFLEHCHEIGSGGIQFPFGARDRNYTEQLRAKAESFQMYLEGSIGLPRDQSEADRFAAEVRTVKEAGATVMRTFMLGGRRYETFTTMEKFRDWADRTFKSLVIAERIIAQHDLRLAVENHKDWRTDELLAILKRLGSPHLGVCVDTGNSIALLEDPYEVVEAYAPFAFSTHLKDMSVAEYEEGFLLSEVPLGEGFLDLKRIVTTLVRARPEVRFSLEMITRDPLKIPCLTPKYWATFDSLSGKYLARTLTMVRKQAPRKSLPTVTDLSQAQKLEREEKNVRQCLTYARERLEL